MTATNLDHVMDTEAMFSAYRDMLRIRLFEKVAYDLFLKGLVKGTTHLATGHEAIAVGTSAALAPDDYVLATYRGHHHSIARGAPMAACFAELLGRASGICAGKGGSMHITSIDDHMLGSYAIVGAHLPIAAGAAWSAKLRGTGQVAVAFMGDGATNIGTFHEALNLAGVWRLPVVYVCENNQYMEYTPIGSVTAVEHPAYDRAGAYGMPAQLIDGNDVEQVYAAAARAVQRARDGEGPTLIEAVTYRHYGHSRTDAAKYRPPGEVEKWMANDPLTRLRDRLLAAAVPQDRIDGLHDEVAEQIAQVVEVATAAPLPDPASTFTDVWADGGSQWRT